jgi:hypothetical protein
MQHNVYKVLSARVLYCQGILRQLWLARMITLVMPCGQTQASQHAALRLRTRGHGVKCIGLMRPKHF